MGVAVKLRGDIIPMPDPAGDADAAIVIPAYNEAASIADVTRRARAVTSRVIVVDDGSIDNTAALAEANGALVLRNVSNSGKGAALRRGMDLALLQGVRYVVTLDGDGQHRPEDVVRLLDC